MSSAVHRGRAFEQWVKEKLKSRGFHVTRSAASQGLWDLVAIHKESKRVILCECKNHKLSPKEKREIEELCKLFEGDYKVEFYVVEKGVLDPLKI